MLTPTQREIAQKMSEGLSLIEDGSSIVLEDFMLRSEEIVSHAVFEQMLDAGHISVARHSGRVTVYSLTDSGRAELERGAGKGELS